MLISFLNRLFHTAYPCYFGVIQMNQYEILDNHKINNYLSEWKANHKFIEMGQLRRIKIHAARLIDTIDDKKSVSSCTASAIRSESGSGNNRFQNSRCLLKTTTCHYPFRVSKHSQNSRGMHEKFSKFLLIKPKR